MALIRAYGAEVIAITLNGRGMLPDDLRARGTQIEADLGIPTSLPAEDGVEGLVAHVRAWMEKAR